MQTRNLLSLAYLTVDGAAPVEHIEASAAGGFDAAGLRIVPPSHLAIDYGVVGNPASIREINRARERTGIGILDIEVFTLNADTDVGRFMPALETVGGDWCVLRAGASARTRISSVPPIVLPRCAMRPRRFGLRVALEFMWFRQLQTIEAASALVIAAGSVQWWRARRRAASLSIRRQSRRGRGVAARAHCVHAAV